MTLGQLRWMMFSVITEIALRGYGIREGSGSAKELVFLHQTAKRPGIRLIGEIGFHLGFSAYAFLESNPEANVVSFDIGAHRYIPAAKKIIDRKFPGRHTLIYGDSRTTVPEFSKQNPDLKFDLIFIDGGHEYETAKADLLNMKSLAHSQTPILMDDLTPWQAWGEGPARAWTEAIQQGLIVQKELYIDGKLVDAMEPPGRRSWALGYCLF